MIGRVYTWRHGYWRVLTRWAGKGPRNVLLEQLIPVAVPQVARMVDGELGPLRVVNGLTFVATGYRVIRPFRGLRRLTSDARPLP